MTRQDRARVSLQARGKPVEGGAFPVAGTSRCDVCFLLFLPFLHSYGVYQIGDV